MHCVENMFGLNGFFWLWTATILACGGASHDGTTFVPIPEAEMTYPYYDHTSYDHPSGEPSPGVTTPDVPFTHYTETVSHSMPLTLEVPEESVLKEALERIDSRNISHSISQFFYYEYDSHTNDKIVDGGFDMYDNGNMVYFSSGDNASFRLVYNTYKTEPGVYELASVAKWPFITLVHINNTDRIQSTFSIRVVGDTGADGSGNLIRFDNYATFNGTNVAFTVTQVYGAFDPTICEVYFAFGNDISLNENFIPTRGPGTGTNDISSGAKLVDYPENVWFGYMLLSRTQGRRIEPHEVENSVKELVGAVLGAGNNSIPFPFQTLPILFPSTEPFTATQQTTVSAPYIPYEIPIGSPIRRAFEGVVPKLGLIASSIPGFYYYSQLNIGGTSISDGGNDMYDGGNMVSFGYDGLSKRRVNYGSFYSLQDTYEFSSFVGWPFVALMYINNTFHNHAFFSVEVTSDAGADGYGYLTHFASNTSSFGIDVAYTVTQVYGAGDPSICEVYLAFSQHGGIESNFTVNRRSTNTNTLNTEVMLTGYPRDSWIGYLLLSKRNGVMVSQDEVSLAVSRFVSGVFGFSYTIPFDFPYSPTQGPVTTEAPTTTPYVQHAYVGFRQEVCGNAKFVESNWTVCAANETAFVTAVTVQLPTNFGFSYPAEGTISGCMERHLCSQGCSNISSMVGYSLPVLSCQSRCCYHSYCNYRYDPYYYPTPSSNYSQPNITIPEAQLPNVQIEVLPNCFFKPLANRLVNCLNNVFDAWPFSSPSTCKSTVSSAVQCGIQELVGCKTSELFSNAMARFPPNFNVQEIIASVEQVEYLDIVCVHPAESIRNATIRVPGPYNSTYHYPLFPQSSIGVGEPLCDNYILDSLLDWGIEFLSVLKTSTSRFEMCRSYKTVINRVLHAAENRCNLEMVSSLIPCDSLLRNQLRALIIQAKELLPEIVPGYCEGVNPPAEPQVPEDIPFLPSCSLRQTIQSIWSCESVFTSKTPYSDEGVCKTNINRMLHCVANRLQECSSGSGYNFFDALSSFIKIEDVLAGIRSLTHSTGCSPYGYNSDFRDVICSSSAMDLPSLNDTFLNFFGLCRGDSSQVFQQIMAAYYNFAGARNSADVCTAFRSARSAVHNFLKSNCNFGLLKYILPVDSTARQTISHGIDILINELQTLDISVCPETISTNATFTPTRWLRSYVRWRSFSLPKWQAAYEKWRSAEEVNTAIRPPSCIDLTKITCKNIGAKLCDSDYFGCSFCYCSDHKYKGLTETVLEPWIQDYDNWENFQASWETKFEEWQQNANE